MKRKPQEWLLFNGQTLGPKTPGFKYYRTIVVLYLKYIHKIKVLKQEKLLRE